MVHTLTLNPAIDKILYLKKLEKNITNRVNSQTETLGGKGTHVSINLSQMAVKNQAFGLVYGATGQSILASLSSCGTVPRFVVGKEGQSRTNYLLIEEDNSCTTIAEKGVSPSPEEVEELLALMHAHIGDGDFLILSGDASNFPDPLIYNRIIAELKSKQLKIFLDTSGEALKRGLESAPYFIKPNHDEMEALCGFEIQGRQDAIRAIASLDRYGIEMVALSLGKAGSVVRVGDAYYSAVPPEVQVRNTAGCGDCFVAGLVHGILRGDTPEEMLRFATAVSSATAASPLSVGYDSAYADSLLALCQVERIQ